MTGRDYAIIGLIVVIAVLFFKGGGPNARLYGDSATPESCVMPDGRNGVIVETGYWPFREELCRARRVAATPKKAP